eukprot:gene18892-25450_t
MKKKVIVSASTAFAAGLIGLNGLTTHYAFGFTSAAWIPVSNHAVNMFIDLADVVFIDEVSMCLGGFLQEIHQRSIDASAMSNDEPFAGKVVVFSGDVHQLPAVCVDRSCTDMSKCPHQPYRWPMWNLFKELSLNTNHRQNPNAPEFINALNHMRCERFELGCQHLELLQTRVVPLDSDFEPSEDATIVSGLNKDKDEYSLAQLRKYFPAEGIVTIKANDSILRAERITPLDIEFLEEKLEQRASYRK